MRIINLLALIAGKPQRRTERKRGKKDGRIFRSEINLTGNPFFLSLFLSLPSTAIRGQWSVSAKYKSVVLWRGKDNKQRRLLSRTLHADWPN